MHHFKYSFNDLLNYTDLFYNHILKLAGLEETLTSLNIKDDVKAFILSLPKEHIQYYISELKKNPNISLDELKNIAKLPKEKSESQYLGGEIKFVESEAGPISKQPGHWAIINLRKLRKGRMDIPDEFYDRMARHGQQVMLYIARDFPKTIEKYTDYINLMNKLNEIFDWYDSQDIEPDIASLSPEQVTKLSDDWHEAMAKAGAGKIYMEGIQNIVYGPTWKNTAFNGWTIRKIKTENDLQVEGNKMNHCVGSYCESVYNETSDIYSLRDPANEPHVTMEANGGTFNFIQIMGHSNSDPKSEYKAMIKEWFKSLGPDKVSMEGSEDFDYANLIHMNPRDIDDELDKIFAGSEGYGIAPSVSNFYAKTAYDEVLKAYSGYRRSSSYQEYMRSAAFSIVEMAIKHDKFVVDQMMHGIKHTHYEPKTIDELKSEWLRRSEIQNLEFIIQKHDEEISDFIMEADLQLDRPEEPEKENYDTIEEYDKAHEEYEKELEKARDEAEKYAYEEYLDHLPYGFDRDIRDALREQLTKDPLTNVDWIKESAAWYYSGHYGVARDL